jgi:uncharacterized LabA/DUF88 family protein
MNEEREERKVGLFIDFENIARGIKDAHYKGFEIKLILERLLEKGKIMVKRAYADWNRYTDYKRPFHEAAIELIDIPQSRYSGKNSADIRMVVDAMDLAHRNEHIDSFAIVSGDSDSSSTRTSRATTSGAPCRRGCPRRRPRPSTSSSTRSRPSSARTRRSSGARW